MSGIHRVCIQPPFDAWLQFDLTIASNDGHLADRAVEVNEAHLEERSNKSFLPDHNKAFQSSTQESELWEGPAQRLDFENMFCSINLLDRWLKDVKFVMQESG